MTSEAPRFAFAPHHCFACGTLNTSGLHLDLHVEVGRSWTELTLPDRFQGWNRIAHGGVLAAILDEVMAWSLVGADNWGVTARMAIDFKRPVDIGQAIRAEGWITRSRRRIVDTEGHILDAATGAVHATATGVFVAADEARKRQLREEYGWVDQAPATSAAPATLTTQAAGAR